MVVSSMEMGSSQERKDSRSFRSANDNGNGGNSNSRSSNGAEDQKPTIPPTNDSVDGGKEKEDEEAGDADADEDDGNSDEDDDDDEEEDDDDEEDGDDGVVRCVCGERNDGELMIECEICQVWQHTLCMGIRDEAHIPDKYYCEKCRPEDHPYINSRPRTLVLAEASALGTSTMMRRSAVMAVAKMTAREEYRSAAAAAAIAASVAAASSLGPPSAGGGGRKTPKKQARKPNGGTPSSTPRSTQRNRKKARRQSQRADWNRSAGENEDDDEDDPDAGDSDHEYARGSRAAGASRSGAGTGGNEDGDDNRNSDIDDDSNGSSGNRTAKSRSQRQGLSGSQRGQKSKRSSVSSGNTTGGSKQRKATAADRSVAIMSPSRRGSNSTDGLLPTYLGESGEADGNESSGMEDDSVLGNGVDDPYYASEDVVARMLGARINETTPRDGRAKSRTPKSRTRSVSTVVKSNNTGDAGRNGLAAMVSPTRQSLKQGFSTGSIGSGSGSGGSKRRGKSVPGSPRLGSRSPSPTLQSLLYDDPDNGGIGVDSQTDTGTSIKPERTSKRRRTGGGGGGSSRIGAAKHKRMTVSATNSPYLGNGSVFGLSGGDVGLERHRGRAASSSATALADSKGKSADVSGCASAFDTYGANDSESAYDEIGKPGGAAGHHISEDQMQEDEDDNNTTGNGNSHTHSRQPKHKFPPLETTDIDGNPIVIPSHLLNNSGQPMYSSADTETMCKIRYPHNKTSVFELNRRAKQLLEWLGKMQSEYEHEAQSWIEPLDEKCNSDGGANNDDLMEENRPASRQVSEAPTTPIDPANWPDEDGYDGGETGDTALKRDHNQPKRPRSTRSIMEDLVWRLIRFQETYST
ncbi:Histone deacetylase complex subunit [Coemansia sp. RSA 1200]|nr:Histone deacetylase complex subunit [Coemansia sp. RSA 1200]